MEDILRKNPYYQRDQRNLAELLPHCSQIPKVARILYNPTDYTKIRATNSSLNYIPFTISAKFSITYTASSIDILVFRGSNSRRFPTESPL